MRRAALLIAVVLGGTACAKEDLDVLVFNRETEWFHTSTPLAAQAIVDAAPDRGWNVRVTDDPAAFTPDQLRDVDVVVFSMTSGIVLDQPGRDALEGRLEAGAGFVGIHSASHTEYDWPYYVQTIVPVQFKTHPFPENVLPGSLTIEADTPLTAGMPSPWAHPDEFYTFQERPEDIDGLQMLLALDESKMSSDYVTADGVGYHPLAFAHELTGGRTFYTALGHPDDCYSDPDFLRMIFNGIDWAGRR